VPARTDRVTDPAILGDLATVRLGTSSFRRALAALASDELDAPCGLPGWTRRHLIAHVGYNARALSRLVTWAATGVEHPMYSSPHARNAEIDLGATLRPQALRSLCEHAAIELDVRWRDLPPDRWSAVVVTAQGRKVPVSQTLWMRTREVWLHAVDLQSGTRFSDIPQPVLRRLLDDVVGLWGQRDEPEGWRLVEQGAATQTWESKQPETVEVRGDLASLASWATGRGSGGIQFCGTHPLTAPRWI
jgi:maleylpyruvate isomerase